MNVNQIKRSLFLNVLGHIFLISCLGYSFSIMRGISGFKKLSFILLLSIYTAFVFSSKKIKFLKFNLIDLIYSLFLTYILFHCWASKNLISNQLHLAELVSFALVYLVIRVKRNNFEFNNFLVYVLVAGIIQAVVGSLQLYHIIPSMNSIAISGTFNNPAPYAIFLSCVASLAIYQILLKPEEEKKFYVSFLSYIAIILIVLVLPATLNRTSWLMLISSFMLLFLFKKRKNLIVFWNNFRFLFVSILFGIPILVGSALYMLKPDSANGRLLIWKVAIYKLLEHPIFGYGFKSFSINYNNWQGDWFRLRESSNLAYEQFLAGNVKFAYNEFLEIWVELGIIGFILFCAIIFMAIINVIKTKKNIQVGVLLITICIACLVSYPLHSMPIKILFIVAIATISKTSKIIFQYNMKLIGSKIISGSLCGLGLCLVLYTVNIYSGFENWKKSDVLFKKGKIKTAIKSYSNNYQKMRFNGLFLQYYGNALIADNNYLHAISILNEAKKKQTDVYLYTMLGDSYKAINDFGKAEMYYTKASYLIPHKLYPNYLLAMLYKDNNMKKNAIERANKVLRMPVKVNSKAVTEMKYEMKQIIDEN
jgi:O-antigen ligase